MTITQMAAQTRPSITITNTDLERLERCVERAPDEGLDVELARATIVPASQVPADVVTMNSRLVFEDLASGARRSIALVFPEDADAGEGKISVLAPIGSAVLGLKVGDEIAWPLPNDRSTRLRIVELTYQPQAAETVASLTATRKAAEDELVQVRLANIETADRLARLTADFEASKRRVEREQLEAVRFANADLVKNIIPVLDDFDRAWAAAEELEGPARAVVEGVALVRALLDDVLARAGVTSFTTLGEPFDPAKAEAIAVREVVDLAAGTVVEELRRGYFLHERLLRPALVVVSAASS